MTEKKTTYQAQETATSSVATSAPTLNASKRDKHNPFVMPEGYIEDFTANIMAQIDRTLAVPAHTEETAVPTTTLSIQPRLKWRIMTRWISGVAAVLAFFLVFAHSENQNSNSSAQSSTSNIQSSEMASSNSDMVYDYMMMDDLKLYDYATNNE